MLRNLKLENSPLYSRKLFHPSVVAGFLATVLLLSFMSVGNRAVFAQIPSIPSLPTEEDEDDTTADSDSQQSLVTDSLQSASNATNIPPPTIEITSLQEGERVPVGELTIEGVSSDDQESDCQVYADVNDVTPMRNVTAVDLGGGGDDDFSRWTFTYSEDYQLIKEGVNELTAKISCFGDGSTPVSEWHSINVTGGAAGSDTVSNTEDQTETDGGEQDEPTLDTPLFGESE
jgi:hypothetical protein